MSNGKLAICVPSRGRPRTFARFLDSFYRHASLTTSDVLLRNGERDPLHGDYAMFEGMPNLVRVVGPDDGFNTTWTGSAGYAPAQQDLYERYPDYAAYLCIEDDTVLETPAFDSWLLSRLDTFPGRVGMIELYDRSQTIHVQCFSAEWCKALGHLCNPAVGELAFELALRLANTQMYRSGRWGAEFTHLPLLPQYGYTGSERAGALSMPNVVSNFYTKREWFYHEWLPLNEPREREKLEAAACAS
jgi:hypothetical protein